jgi:hypothetical protein
MDRVRTNQGRRAGAAAVALCGGVLLLAGCSSNSMTTTLLGGDVNFGGSGPTKSVGAPGATDIDVPCPELKVRNGASTLVVGSKPGEGEPAPLDVRYQGSIVNYARECHLNAGLLSVKVGVEGRVITGPAGAPGSLNVPLRMAVVQEGVNPRTVLSKLAVIPVTVNNSVDRVTFTHIDPDISFPLPPGNAIDDYVIYIGFDPQGTQPQRKAPVKHKGKPKAKPKVSAAPPPVQ